MTACTPAPRCMWETCPSTPLRTRSLRWGAHRARWAECTAACNSQGAGWLAAAQLIGVAPFLPHLRPLRYPCNPCPITPSPLHPCPPPGLLQGGRHQAHRDGAGQAQAHPLRLLLCGVLHAGGHRGLLQGEEGTDEGQGAGSGGTAVRGEEPRGRGPAAALRQALRACWAVGGAAVSRQGQGAACTRGTQLSFAC